MPSPNSSATSRRTSETIWDALRVPVVMGAIAATAYLVGVPLLVVLITSFLSIPLWTHALKTRGMGAAAEEVGSRGQPVHVTGASSGCWHDWVAESKKAATVSSLVPPWRIASKAEIEALSVEEGTAVQRVPAGLRYSARFHETGVEACRWGDDPTLGILAPDRLLGEAADRHFKGWHLDIVMTPGIVHLLDGCPIGSPNAGLAERLAALEVLAKEANDANVLPAPTEFRVVPAHLGAQEVAEAMFWYQGQEVLLTNAQAPFRQSSSGVPRNAVLCRP